MPPVVSAIPAWNISGILPPVRPGVEGHSRDRSPYFVSLLDVITRFGTTRERVQILKGLLAYRQELARHQVTNGFQWLNGSFMENKEALYSESPKDIDVVTFFRLPAGQTQRTFLPVVNNLFDCSQTKLKYHVDAYPCVIGGPMEVSEIRNVSYWYSMWSHRRNGNWKGFVQVNLSDLDDEEAKNLIEEIDQDGGLL